MKLGVILPHTLLYGGVKRFMELGNIFVEKGHQFFIYTQDGIGPTWFDFRGEMKTFEDITSVELDAIFFTEPRYIPLIQEAKSKRKIFYFVRGNENLKKIKIIPNVEFFANSTNMYNTAKRKFGITCFKAFGGINTKHYQPKEHIKRDSSKPFIIMAYGRLTEGRKGTRYVVKACERIYKKNKNIKLILFDTPVDEKMKKAIEDFDTIVPFEFVTHHPVMKNPELFQKADLFVAPEKKAGWSNTSVEAMASGIPVIASTSGTNDFLFHEKTGLIIRRNSRHIAKAIVRLMEDDKLCQSYAEAGRKQIENFDWHVLADRIEKHLR